MKKVLILFLLLLQSNLQGQFYNKLNDVFLTKTLEESVFSNDLEYLRNWLQSTTNKCFMGNLQTSMSNNGNSNFYGLDLIPRGNFSNKLFETGITFNLIGVPTKEIIKMPLTFRGNINIKDNPKKGNGFLQNASDKIFIEFPKTILVAVLEKFNKQDSADILSKFTISDINYDIDEGNIFLKLIGKFNLPVKLLRERKSYSNIKNLEIVFTKENLKIYLINDDSKSGVQNF
ncbi:MAG: hypothetical protein H7174_12525 [Flavobacterium sp.]|nr:hypothetical protein [Flavobacterium sp.]